jgi:hypothetical protein
MNGIDYPAYKKLRCTRELIHVSLLEKPQGRRSVIYFGRVHLTDVSSATEARGYFKIGKSDMPNVMMRLRNQPGSEFRLYAEVLIDGDVNRAEKVAHTELKPWQLSTTHLGQTELFNIPDDSLERRVEQVCKALNNTMGNSHAHVKEVLLFNCNKISVIK